MGGRAKGTRNDQEKAQIRGRLLTIVHKYITTEGVRTLEADLQVMRPAERAPLMEKFLKYCIPTLGTINPDDEGNSTPMEILVRHVKSQVPKDEDTSDIDYSDKDFRD